MVDNKLPRMAGFVLLDLINSSFYYKDVLFYFLARIIDPNKVNVRMIEKIVHEFMSIENPHDLKKLLNAFIVNYQLASVVDEKYIAGNIRIIFTEILKNTQLD